MPPWGLHMILARQLAAEQPARVLQDEPGAYYLGATAPDIRAIAKVDRSRTHFFELTNFDHQCGVEAMFREHPDLASPACLDDSQIAFLCGYISHLEMDEAWICDVYRPCFGERSPLQGDLLANLLDRVLQFELDRQAREDKVAVEAIRHDLLASTVREAVEFLDYDDLMRWREVSADVMDREPDWERFGQNVGRHLRARETESETDLAHYLRNIPDLLDQSVRAVTQERIEAFQQRARGRALEALRAYLS
ncbi:MAG: zinc dependent phospholipase C family protein [Dehalococcoidia bacterium]